MINTNLLFLRHLTYFAKVYELFEQQITGFGFAGAAFPTDHYGLIGLFVEHKLICRIGDRKYVRRIGRSHLIAVFFLLLRKHHIIYIFHI